MSRSRIPGWMNDVRLSCAAFATGAAATVVFLLAPSGSVGRTLAWAVPFVLAVVLLAARAAASGPDTPRALRLLLAGAAVYVGASFIWYLGPVHLDAVLPFPSPLDALFFASYALYAAFLLAMLRRRAPDSPLESRLAVTESAIFSLALSAVLLVGVAAPSLANGTEALPTFVALLYPAVQLVLFALAVRLLAVSSGHGHRVVLLLLFVWIGGELLADVLYGVQSANGTFRYDGPLVPLWMMAYTGLAAFAAHPGVVAFLQPAAADPATSQRDPAARSAAGRLLQLTLLLLAAVVPLALAAFTRGHDPALMTVAAVAFGLALYRASLLAGGLTEQRQLAAQLEKVLDRLRAQHDDLARLGAAVDASDEAIVTCSPEGVILDWNSGAERLYGHRRHEAVGQPAEMFLPVDETETVEATLAQVQREGHIRLQRLAVRKDGSTVEVEITMSRVVDPHGRLMGTVEISRAVTERNALQRELAAHAARLDEAQRLAGIGSWEWNVRTDELNWSSELYRILAMDEGVPGTRDVFLDRVHPDDQGWVAQEFARLHADMDFDVRIVRPGGEVRWLTVRGVVERDEAGSPVRRTGTVQDITERTHLQRELAAHAARLDEAQRVAGVGSFERDLTTGRDVWSSEYYRLMGVEEGTAASYALYLDLLHPEDRPWVEQQITTHDPARPLEYEARVVMPDGAVRWIAVRGEIETDACGVPVRKSGTAHDITDRKAGQVELERLALTDTLTGLPNRTRFTRLLTAALDRAGAAGTVGLLLLDLDGFKDVNDGIGHHAGDLVLQEVARRICGVLRGDNELARLGGDEFAVVLPAIGDIGRAIEVATAVRACLAPPFDLDGIAVHVGGSVGITVSTGPTEPGALLKKADVAMYRAKTLSSGWAVFEPDQDDMAVGRLQLVADLRAAIDSGELQVAFEPILDTRTGRVSAFEALARWHHPDKGIIPPDRFVPLAEQADLIVPLTRLVLSKAVTACAAWRRAGHDLRVGVNLSVQVMQTADPCQMVRTALAEVDLDPQHLILEITESSLATDAENINATLSALRELGVKLVIDDFGTGYSAMSYLKQLPVEEIKIDRSFVRDIALDNRDLAIVRSLIRLAHSLSLRVVAEGVESLSALEVLTALGCDFVQGYAVARSMPEGDVLEWLAGYDASPPAWAVGREPTDLLIVDDDRVVRAWLTALATQAGWRVREASSAEDALVQVEQVIPDVVILDHHMPGMSGTDSVPELRARGVDGPILLFTQFLSDAIPSLRVPLDVWPVSKSNPDGVLELLDGYRASTRQSPARHPA